MCACDPLSAIILKLALNIAAAAGLEALPPPPFSIVVVVVVVANVVSLNESKLPLQNPTASQAGWPDSLF